MKLYILPYNQRNRRALKCHDKVENKYKMELADRSEKVCKIVDFVATSFDSDMSITDVQTKQTTIRKMGAAFVQNCSSRILIRFSEFL